MLLVVSVCFVVEMFIVKPSGVDILVGMIPTMPSGAVFVAVSVIGATVMPHNLYLHSAAVRRSFSRSLTVLVFLSVSVWCVYVADEMCGRMLICSWVRDCVCMSLFSSCCVPAQLCLCTRVHACIRAFPSAYIAQVLTRPLNRRDHAAMNKAQSYFALDTILSLSLSFLVNLAILVSCVPCFGGCGGPDTVLREYGIPIPLVSLQTHPSLSSWVSHSGGCILL